MDLSTNFRWSCNKSEVSVILLFRAKGGAPSYVVGLCVVVSCLIQDIMKWDENCILDSISR